MPLRRLVFAATALATALCSIAAHAEPTVLDPVKISVRPVKPVVTEIANPPKAIDGANVKQPVMSKIVGAVSQAPF